MNNETERLQKAADRIIVALDFPQVEEAEQLLAQLAGVARYVKIGMQMFYLAGPRLISLCKDQGFSVFLDLKVHDIPNTARGAMQSLAGLGVDMVNLHAAGGKEMMEAAREGLERGTLSSFKRPLLLAVTQLTSTSRTVMNEQIGIPGSVEECVLRYAELARESGLDGVVASPLEVPAIKQHCGKDFFTVTPGVRPKSAEHGDQQRVTSPGDAFSRGSDYIVIGRPVTLAADPRLAFAEIVREAADSING